MKGSEEIRGGVKDSEGSKTGDSVILVSLSEVLSSTKTVFCCCVEIVSCYLHKANFSLSVSLFFLFLFLFWVVFD